MISTLSAELRKVRAVLESSPYSFRPARWLGAPGDTRNVSAAEASIGSGERKKTYDIHLLGSRRFKPLTGLVFDVEYRADVVVFVPAKLSALRAQEQKDVSDLVEDLAASLLAKETLDAVPISGAEVRYETKRQRWVAKRTVALRYEYDAAA